MNRPILFGVATLAAALCVTLTAATGTRASGQASAIDLTDAGTHDPQLGAWALASGIGRTDARFKMCGWPPAEWRPLRKEALAIAPRVFAKAGLPATRIGTDIRRSRQLTLMSATHFSKSRQ